MTTTLRPAEAERTTADGVRSRRYDICVNSRPVGSVELGTHPRFGPEAGRITGLTIDPPDRRRGRATVAALAAEEVLRGWGCRRVEIAVPAEAEGALALATTLGYRERGRNMLKRLDGAPALPDGSTTRPIGEAEYPGWLARERAEFLASLVRGGIPEEVAAARADGDYRSLLPDGPATSGAVLRTLTHRGTDVGTIWIATESVPAGGGDAYVFSVEVAEEYRGRGHGRTLMLVAERESLAAGAHTLGLHVFADNPPALRLYESLGYEVTQRNLSKPLA
ncbi:GNAT family N-acetyltransferase [Streptomyces pactum]|uniref:GNAT family N-acetyltransferase n=1 Tax=Streptomyces pactum TaxID=68249 RepID=A0ABS0NRT5_9ACTN|nr:GNAT family N-acetyltransferase [Streptomyces pactum]MBH5337916.1 GNAT family N-acetyltransferase [Streptomyces pactum]